MGQKVHDVMLAKMKEFPSVETEIMVSDKKKVKSSGISGTPKSESSSSKDRLNSSNVSGAGTPRGLGGSGSNTTSSSSSKDRLSTLAGASSTSSKRPNQNNSSSNDTHGQPTPSKKPKIGTPSAIDEVANMANLSLDKSKTPVAKKVSGSSKKGGSGEDVPTISLTGKNDPIRQKNLQVSGGSNASDSAKRQSSRWLGMVTSTYFGPTFLVDLCRPPDFSGNPKNMSLTPLPLSDPPDHQNKSTTPILKNQSAKRFVVAFK